MNEFNPDWDLLEATEGALREYMTLYGEHRATITRLEGEDKELRDGISGLISEWITKGQNVRQIFPATPTTQQLEWQWKECAKELESLLKGEK